MLAYVSQILTSERNVLDERIGRLSERLMTSVDEGLKLVLGLG